VSRQGRIDNQGDKGVFGGQVMTEQDDDDDIDDIDDDDDDDDDKLDTLVEKFPGERRNNIFSGMIILRFVARDVREELDIFDTD